MDAISRPFSLRNPAFKITVLETEYGEAVIKQAEKFNQRLWIAFALAILINSGMQSFGENYVDWDI